MSLFPDIQDSIEEKLKIVKNVFHEVHQIDTDLIIKHIIPYYNSINRYGFNITLTGSRYPTLKHDVLDQFRDRGFNVIFDRLDIETKTMIDNPILFQKHLDDFFDHDKENVFIYYRPIYSDLITKCIFKIEFSIKERINSACQNKLHLYSSYHSYKTTSILREIFDNNKINVAFSPDLKKIITDSDIKYLPDDTVENFTDTPVLILDFEFPDVQYEILKLPNGNEEFRVYKYFSLVCTKSDFNQYKNILHGKIYNGWGLDFQVLMLDYRHGFDSYNVGVVITVHNEDKNRYTDNTAIIEEICDNKLSDKFFSVNDQIIQALLSSYCKSGLTIEEAAFKIIDRIKGDIDWWVNYRIPGGIEVSIALSFDDIYLVWLRSGKLRSVKNKSFNTYTMEELKKLGFTRSLFCNNCCYCGCGCSTIIRSVNDDSKPKYYCSKECYDNSLEAK